MTLAEVSVAPFSFTARPNIFQQSFGGSLKSLVLKMASGRLQSPEDLIARLRWKSAGVQSLIHVEARYQHALIRYLKGKGIVRHPVFDMDSLTEEERGIAPDDSRARALMFLMTVTGTQQLPPDDGQIDVGHLSLIFLSCTAC